MSTYENERAFTSSSLPVDSAPPPLPLLSRGARRIPEPGYHSAGSSVFRIELVLITVMAERGTEHFTSVDRRSGLDGRLFRALLCGPSKAGFLQVIFIFALVSFWIPRRRVARY